MTSDGKRVDSAPRPPVAVFGASGRAGQAQVRQLRMAGYPTLAVTRNPDTLAHSDFAGARCMAADFRDVESIKAVLEKVEAVFLQLPSMAPLADSLQFMKNFTEAALAAGRPRMIYDTMQWAPDDGPCGVPFCDFTRAAEDVVMNAGLDATVFRPVIFMDNLLTLIWKVPIVEEGVYRYCHRPGMRANWIAMDDVAKFMIAALHRPDLIGRRFNIGGPEALPIETLVEQLSAAMGRSIAFEYLPPRAFGRQLHARMMAASASADMFGADAENLADFYDAFYTFNENAAAPPFEVDVAALLREIPVKLTSFADWARAQDWTMARSQEKVGGLLG